MSARRVKILETLKRYYGPSPMTDALSKALDEKWDDFVRDSHYSEYGDTLEREVTNYIWMWFSGGGTAHAAALKLIEEVSK